MNVPTLSSPHVLRLTSFLWQTLDLGSSSYRFQIWSGTPWRQEQGAAGQAEHIQGRVEQAGQGQEAR